MAANTLLLCKVASRYIPCSLTLGICLQCKACMFVQYTNPRHLPLRNNYYCPLLVYTSTIVPQSSTISISALILQSGGFNLLYTFRFPTSFLGLPQLGYTPSSLYIAPSCWLLRPLQRFTHKLWEPGNELYCLVLVSTVWITEQSLIINTYNL